MHGVRLRLAYEGSGFHGWQRQEGLRSVQGTLEGAVAEILKRPRPDIEVKGASRTDAGVHAADQVAAFDSPIEIPARGWLRALNTALPHDIVIKEAASVTKGYNPRFDAKGKRYRYLFLVRDLRDPFWGRRAWLLDRRFRDRRGQLDREAMEEAAEVLVGEHDFRAFRSARDPRQKTVRRLTRVELRTGAFGEPDLWALEVSGDAFLQHMVRILAGTLMEVGRRRISREQVEALLGPGGDRREAGPTAPSHGLTLMKIELGRLKEKQAKEDLTEPGGAAPAR